MNANGTGQVQAGPVIEPSREVVGTTERVAKVVYHLLVEDAEMTTAEVAAMTGITWQGAEQLLDRASRVVPITKYESKWRRF